MTYDSEKHEILTTYSRFINNTGGNSPLELLNSLEHDESMFATNIVRYMLAFAVQAQLHLLMDLRRAGMLIDPEQAKAQP